MLFGVKSSFAVRTRLRVMRVRHAVIALASLHSVERRVLIAQGSSREACSNVRDRSAHFALLRVARELVEAFERVREQLEIGNREHEMNSSARTRDTDSMCLIECDAECLLDPHAQGTRRE